MRGPARRRLAALLLLAAAPALPAAAQPADSAHAPPLLERRDALYAAAPLAATLLLARLDDDLNDALRRPAVQEPPALRAGAGLFRLVGYPGVGLAAAGAYAAGRATGRPHLADAGLHVGESMLVAGAVTGALKLATGRVRPRASADDALDFSPGRGLSGGDYRSFPSGHTALAFAAAGAAASEIRHRSPGGGRTASGLLYGAAALTGVSRLYHGGHWATDVLAGAVIGSWSGRKTVAVNHAHPGNRLDRLFLQRAAVVPVPGGVAVVFSAAR